MTPLQQFIQDLENVVDPETKEWIEKNKGFYIKLEEDEIVKAYNKAELNSGCMLQLGKGLILTFTFIGFALWFWAGYVIGKHQERIKWNDLIKDGILPKPKNKNNEK